MIEAYITGPKGAFDCPVELRLYGTNEPMERENLMNQMRADKLPMGCAANLKRQEAVAQKLDKQAAKQAKGRGDAIVSIGSQHDGNAVSDYMAASSSGQGSGPSMEGK